MYIFVNIMFVGVIFVKIKDNVLKVELIIFVNVK